MFGAMLGPCGPIASSPPCSSCSPGAGPRWREVALELEVSPRTARRDLEALAMAGVPVYSQAGRGGGWSLVGGARTDLSGLNAAEARALFLVAGPGAATPEVKAALRKLVRALPETFRASAESAGGAVIIDASDWDRLPVDPPPHLAALQQAVVDGVQVRLHYAGRDREPGERVVHPSGSWPSARPGTSSPTPTPGCGPSV